MKGFYDALSAHPSGFSNPPGCTPATPQCSLSGGFNNDDSFFAFTRVGEYRALMMQQGEGTNGLDYVVGIMQWNLNFQAAVPQTDEKWGFGIIRSDLSARPAYAALLEMPKP